MPRKLEPGILYFSKEFSTASHMCPCGCDNKIITPLGPTEWSLKIKGGKPTLYPSVGNWQIPCRSHYWIRNGEIVWSNLWTEEQILAGRQNEEDRRKSYYHNLEHKQTKRSIFLRMFNWVFGRN